MNSETVDLIYLDPPFNSKQDYAAPIGSQAAGAHFKDTWTLSDIDLEWIGLVEEKNPALHRVLLAAMTDSDKSYLAYMAARLMEMPRLLKPTGSIYLHCDPTMSHYLKLVMDAIFGRSNKAFRNEIVWCYSGGGVPKNAFARKHEIILFYAASKEATFNRQYRPYGKHNTTGHRATSLGGTRETAYNDKGAAMNDWWTDCPPLINWSSEAVGYPTQKPLKLLDRIIKASTNEGDLVLDPFCGCATTCVSAENNKREWVGIDLSSKAGDLVMERLGAGSKAIRRTDITLRDDLLRRTDLGDLPRYNSREVKGSLFGKQQGLCAGCRKDFDYRNLEVDHYIARSKGGTDHISNLQLLCGACNRDKGNRGMPYLMEKLQLGAAAGG